MVKRSHNLRVLSRMIRVPRKQSHDLNWGIRLVKGHMTRDVAHTHTCWIPREMSERGKSEKVSTDSNKCMFPVMSPVARRFADGWVCIVKRMLAKLSSSSLQYWILWGIEVVGGSSVAAICVVCVCVCVCVCVHACVCMCGVGVCATCVCVWLCLFGVYRHKNKEELGLQGYVYICVWYVHVCIYVCKCACMYEGRLKEEARIGKCSNEWCQLQWYTHFWVSTSASQLKKM